MIYVKGKFISAEPVETKSGYEYLQLAIENELYLKYPHLVQCVPNLDYSKYIDKDGIITLSGLYVSTWSDRLKKYTPIGVKISYSSKA